MKLTKNDLAEDAIVSTIFKANLIVLMDLNSFG